MSLKEENQGGRQETDSHQSFREGLLQQGEAQREPWVLLPALPCAPTQVGVSLLPGSCSCYEICSQIPQAAAAAPSAGICCASRKYVRKCTVLPCLLLVSLFVLCCLTVVWICLLLPSLAFVLYALTCARPGSICFCCGSGLPSFFSTSSLRSLSCCPSLSNSIFCQLSY